MIHLENHRAIKGILLDLDGVLWRGSKPIPGAAETVKQLKASGYAVRFVSNNSLLGSRGMHRHFERLGIDAQRSEIVLATEVLARALARKQARGTVYLLGSAGFREDLEAAGLRVIDEPEEIDYLTDFVVVGGDRELNYTKLTRALRCMLKGALLAAPNVDRTYPMEDGLLVPGTGAIVAAITAMVRRGPEIMVGKPKPDLLLAAAQSAGLDPAECVMVGDTIDTDIQAAHAAGMRSILVLTGNATQEDAAAASPPPWRIAPSITDVPRLIAAA